MKSHGHPTHPLQNVQYRCLVRDSPWGEEAQTGSKENLALGGRVEGAPSHRGGRKIGVLMAAKC